jgi:hypothetical protein
MTPTSQQAIRLAASATIAVAAVPKHLTMEP